MVEFYIRVTNTQPTSDSIGLISPAHLRFWAPPLLILLATGIKLRNVFILTVITNLFKTVDSSEKCSAFLVISSWY
jgi:hypothetical protein